MLSCSDGRLVPWVPEVLFLFREERAVKTWLGILWITPKEKKPSGTQGSLLVTRHLFLSGEETMGNGESVISSRGGFATSQVTTKIWSFLKHKRRMRLMKF